MLCKIADLLTEVPAAGDLISRCSNYSVNAELGADIVIYAELFEPDYWPNSSTENMVYMESGIQFNSSLLHHGGLHLHASAIAYGGAAYLFSGPCGAGKSTHAKLWQSVFGDEAVVINDDKPALRRIDGQWIAYGTPWCGKAGINVNMSAPVAGICFLKQADHNSIRSLSAKEAMKAVVSQTARQFKNTEKLDLMLSHVDKLVLEVPVFEMENRPEPAAAHLSYETMLRAAEEAGL